MDSEDKAPSRSPSRNDDVDKSSRVALVIELMLDMSSKAARGDAEAKNVLLGLPLVMHDLLGAGDDDLLFAAIQERLGSTAGSGEVELLLRFIAAWCLSGRSMTGPLLDALQKFVEAQGESAAKKECLARIGVAQNDFSPVLGRWRSNISPRSNLFVWLQWDTAQIGAALTCMCLPFFRLRAFEFDEKRPGKHLKDLNLRYNSVSRFVAVSVLSAAIVSKKQGIVAVEKWLDVAANLRERRNYHMLFAVQNALEMHQVERLKFLFKGVSKKHASIKKSIDQLFSATDRMKLLKQELASVVGKEPLVPCVFWLVQKAALLQETPVLTGDGKLNGQRVLAASNIFVDLAPMQEKRYPPLREDEQILWYLMRLEREVLCSEEDMYKLSDAAKKLGSRFQIGGGLSKSKIAERSAAEAAMSAPVMSSPKKKASLAVVPDLFRKTSNPSTPTGGSGATSPHTSEDKSSEHSDEHVESSGGGEGVASDNPLSLRAVMEMADIHVTGKDDKQFLSSVATMF